jgi:hypothetical protein
MFSVLLLGNREKTVLKTTYVLTEVNYSYAITMYTCMHVYLYFPHVVRLAAERKAEEEEEAARLTARLSAQKSARTSMYNREAMVEAAKQRASGAFRESYRGKSRETSPRPSGE